jgi:hypothetical protein
MRYAKNVALLMKHSPTYPFISASYIPAVYQLNEQVDIAVKLWTYTEDTHIEFRMGYRLS